MMRFIGEPVTEDEIEVINVHGTRRREILLHLSQKDT